MSENKKERPVNPAIVAQFAPAPSTTRGAGAHISCDPKGEHVIYASGKNVVVRNIADPDKCLVYRGHNADVTRKLA